MGNSNIADLIAAIAPSIQQLAPRTGYHAFSGPITRPNNTTSYTANDVLGTRDPVTIANAGPAAIQFAFTGMPLPGPNGVEFMIATTELQRNVSALISGETSYNLYLYSVLPASVLVDNAPFDFLTTDLGFLGKVGLGTPVDEGSNLYVRQDGVDALITLPQGVNTIYGYLVTVGAYAPAANTVLNVNLHGFIV